jgi:predicted nucleotidyltransferase component of viral defense system
MNLHTNTADFTALITFTAKHFNIIPAFVEKDYWITLALSRLSYCNEAENAVFKGGTSLSKGYRIINRFSEDIDIAIINENLSGNAVKTKIRNIEKKITIGSFANPYPYVKQEITSFITEYLTINNQAAATEEYGLQPFTLNVLDKRQTMIEKLVSLFRFSFSANPRRALSAKIRHFYDLYYLVKDNECAAYIQTPDFKRDFAELLVHDKQTFDAPENWSEKEITQSPLVTDFPVLWNFLKDVYMSELSQLAFVAVPNEKEVATVFSRIIERI